MLSRRLAFECRRPSAARMPCCQRGEWDPKPQWIYLGHADRVDASWTVSCTIDRDGLLWITKCRLCRLLGRLQLLANLVDPVPAWQLRQIVDEFRREMEP